MAYSYKGAIAFGLIYIPVTLHAVVKNNDIKFHMLDKKTKSRVQYKKTCVDCGDRLVAQKDIVKGFEYEEGKYVLFSEEDFEKIKSKKDKNITIEQFADADEIDPVYYDRAFYVMPNGGEKAYRLLTHAMQKENKVGVAKCVMGNKQVLIALRAKEGGLILNTLFFHEEIQQNPTQNIRAEVGEKELSMAEMLIENMSKPFDISQYKDEYREKVQSAIEAKIAGKEIAEPKSDGSNKVINLMEALEKSLKGYSKPKKRAAAK